MSPAAAVATTVFGWWSHFHCFDVELVIMVVVVVLYYIVSIDSQ